MVFAILRKCQTSIYEHNLQEPYLLWTNHLWVCTQMLHSWELTGAMFYKWWTKHLAIVSNWFMMGKLFHFQMVVSLFVKYKSCTYKHIFQDRLIYYDQTIYNYVNKCFTDDEFCKNN